LSISVINLTKFGETIQTKEIKILIFLIFFLLQWLQFLNYELVNDLLIQDSMDDILRVRVLQGASISLRFFRCYDILKEREEYLSIFIYKSWPPLSSQHHRLYIQYTFYYFSIITYNPKLEPPLPHLNPIDNITYPPLLFLLNLPYIPNLNPPPLPHPSRQYI